MASEVMEINVGGVHYSAKRETLTSDEGSVLATLFLSPDSLPKDSTGRCFLDRNGVLFEHILDYLRTKRVVLPENFSSVQQLKREAEYFGLVNMVAELERGPTPSLSVFPSTRRTSESAIALGDKYGTITLGYRGAFPEGVVDVKFRKLHRILVCGKVNLCRMVFKDTLNESRDVDRGDPDRCSNRFYLRHNFLEQAFDMLLDAGFELKSSCGAGISSPMESRTSSPQRLSPGKKSSPTPETEENKWHYYNEYVWCRI